MIDLHTHTLLSDGELLPGELARRAEAAGCECIAITDHVDHSNIEMVVGSLVRVSEKINLYWNIRVIPGVEITHVPLECFGELAGYARENGAVMVVAHGESPVEPVLPGTNRAAIEAGVDILAHPGTISDEDAALAAEKGVALELTTRGGHSRTNQHVFNVGRHNGARLVLNTDAHSPGDILDEAKAEIALSAITADEGIKNEVLDNSRLIMKDKLGT
jgi:histidinol phosphatase-like PHP family hydrolase